MHPDDPARLARIRVARREAPVTRQLEPAFGYWSACSMRRGAASLAPLEEPDAYRDVPRRVLGKDGKIRPWAPPAGLGAPRPG